MTIYAQNCQVEAGLPLMMFNPDFLDLMYAEMDCVCPGAALTDIRGMICGL